MTYIAILDLYCSDCGILHQFHASPCPNFYIVYVILTIEYQKTGHLQKNQPWKHVFKSGDNKPSHLLTFCDLLDAGLKTPIIKVLPILGVH